jgi:hypothetical protein
MTRAASPKEQPAAPTTPGAAMPGIATSRMTRAVAATRAAPRKKPPAAPATPDTTTPGITASRRSAR